MKFLCRSIHCWITMILAYLTIHYYNFIRDKVARCVYFIVFSNILELFKKVSNKVCMYASSLITLVNNYKVRKYLQIVYWHCLLLIIDLHYSRFWKKKLDRSDSLLLKQLILMVEVQHRNTNEHSSCSNEQIFDYRANICTNNCTDHSDHL